MVCLTLEKFFFPMHIHTSGGSNTTVDYLMTWKRDRRGLKDAKAFLGEEVVSLHRLMVCDLEVKRSRLVQQEKFRPRRKVWKLRNPVARKRFEEVIDIEEGEGVNQMWEKTQDSLLKATEVCGWTKGHARHIQTQWWNEEVRAVIEMKKVKFIEWQKAKAKPRRRSEAERICGGKERGKESSS